jgi:nucleotide-binding universal stress UspA family protein
MTDSNRVVIVAGVDTTTTNEAVVRAAAAIAGAYSGAELHLIHVLDRVDPSALTSQLERARELLESMEKIAGPARLTLHISAGEPWKQVVQLAANLHADMVVVGTHDMTKVERALLGSVAEKVVRNAQCPVFTVRPKAWHEKPAPQIEPACPDCLRTQRDTGGAKLWCERHGQRHAHGKLHYEIPESFGVGSMLLHTDTA